MKAILFFVASFVMSSQLLAQDAFFLNVKPLGFTVCSATGNNIASKYDGETVSVLIKSEGIFVVRGNKKVEPFFTATNLCRPTLPGDAACGADEIDVSNDVSKPMSYASLEKKCGSNAEVNVPESNRSIPAHLVLLINYSSSSGASKTGSGSLSCTGLNNKDYGNHLTLTDCK